MKILLCRACGDLFRLWGEEKACRCGKTRGKYLDEKKAVYSGPAMPLGLDNEALSAAATAAPSAPATINMFKLKPDGPNFRRAP